MKHIFKNSVIVLMMLALMGVAWAGEDKEVARPQLEMDLADGSRLLGTTTLEAVPIETSYAKVNLPLPQLATLVMGADHETATLSMRNGDQIKGVVNLGSIKLETIFGPVSVGIEHVRAFRVLTGRALTAALKEGLVLHYAFDRNEGDRVKDLSGKGNHGSVSGARYTEEGLRSGAYSLNGNNEHITAPNSNSLEVRECLTLSVWVNLSSFSSVGYGNEHGYVVNKGDDVGWNPAFCIGYTKGEGFPLFHVGTEPGGKSAQGAEPLKTGVWCHLVGVYDGAAAKLYVNGRLVKTEAASGALRSDRAPVHLGGGKLMGVDWGNQFTINGKVDEVMIFNRALDEREVRQLYHAGQ